MLRLNSSRLLDKKSKKGIKVKKLSFPIYCRTSELKYKDKKTNIVCLFIIIYSACDAFDVGLYSFI